MPVWKIVIEGTTSMDVQGVTLRESVVRIARKLGISCKVRNRKDEKRVEVICGGTDQQAKILQEDLKKIPDHNPLVSKEIVVSEPFQYVDPLLKEADLEGQEIEREDQLTEMVWALQNAGRVIMLQEELKVDSMMRALKGEFQSMEDVLEKIESRENSLGECLPTLAIENLLRNVPAGSQISQNSHLRLYDLHRLVAIANRMIEKGKGETDIPTEQIRKLIEELRSDLGRTKPNGTRESSE